MNVEANLCSEYWVLNSSLKEEGGTPHLLTAGSLSTGEGCHTGATSHPAAHSLLCPCPRLLFQEFGVVLQNFSRKLVYLVLAQKL